MKFKEAWRISKTVAAESVFKGNLQMSGGLVSMSAQKDLNRFVKRARSNVIGTKVVSTIVYGVLSAMAPLILFLQGNTFGTRLAVTSVFFFFGLLFLVSLNLMYMTSFVSGEALSPLAALPFSRKDLSRISFLSFIRLMDIPLAVFIITYPVIYGVVTASIVGAVIVFVLNFLNTIMAVFLTFFLARAFYTRIISTGGSRAKSALRMVLTLIWGFGTFGAMYFLSYILTWIGQLIPFFAFLENPEYSWALMIYPFSFGYIASLGASSFSSSAILPSLLSSQSIIAILSSSFYAVLIYLAYKRGTGALRQLSLGEIEMGAKITPPSKDIRLSVGRVFSSIIRKDLKLASRNPGYAAFLVMPVMGVIVFAFITSSYPAMRVIGVLSALLYSSFFMLFFSLSTMWFESKGVSVLPQLPISTRKVVQAKSLFSAVMSFTMPATLALLSFFKPLTTYYSLVISTIEVGAVYAGSIMATTLTCSVFGQGRLPSATFEGHMLKYAFVIMVASIFVFAPIAAYVFTFMFLARDSLISVAAMAITTIVEIILVNLISKAALKD